MTKVFTPIKVGRMQLPHRIAMAPLTRFRADDFHIPLPFVKEYYAQRAAVPGSLLITEATFIAPNAGGYPNIPGIYSPEQIKAWKEVTDAVHRNGSYIYLQLWALGRAANPDILKKEGGYDVVSSSATAMGADKPVPRALTEQEIERYIADYAQAARNAVHEAGFDGVEIHAANGYLIDQFTQDTVNKRTDKWGGSVENRARFALEVTGAVAAAVGADRTGIRLSPWSTFQGMRMEQPIPQFDYLIRHLGQYKLAYLHLVESRISGPNDAEGADKLDFALDAYGKASPVIIAGGYDAQSTVDAVDAKYKDIDAVVGVGRYYISNPDLPYRVRENIPLAPYVRDTFYLPKERKGYTDYPFSEKFVNSELHIKARV